MNGKAAFLPGNLSAISLLLVYVVMVVNHLIGASFDPADQLGLFFIMLPFILTGMALDFILRRNKTMTAGVHIAVRLLPLGIFLMQLAGTVMMYLDMTSPDIFNYLIWLFLALPFFIASYEREGQRQRSIRSLIGTGAVIIAYVYLTTQTDVLDRNYGALVYFMSFFLMLYTASGIKKAPYLGTAVGILTAVALLLLRYFPVTAGAREYGWDYDIFGKAETLIILTFVLCILIRLYEAVKSGKHANSCG